MKKSQNELSTGFMAHIQEAYILLEYATSQGKAIDQQVIAVIVSSKHALQADEWDAEKEIQFWNAYNTLAKMVAPVTIVSLKTTYAISHDNQGNVVVRESMADNAVKNYQRWTLLVLAVLLLTQIYWLFGRGIIDEVKINLPDQISRIEEKIIVPMQGIMMEAESQELDEERFLILETIRVQYEDEQRNLRSSVDSYYGILWGWSRIICLEIFCRVTEEEYKKGGFTRVVHTAELILKPIQLYILPLLYGLLGASAYVLRHLTSQIKDLTYSPSSNARYKLRLQLGSLSGWGVGWFISVDPNSGTMFQALSPMALSFLAGYSVELLFAAMDKIVSAFSKEAPK